MPRAKIFRHRRRIVNRASAPVLAHVYNHATVAGFNDGGSFVFKASHGHELLRMSGVGVHFHHPAVMLRRIGEIFVPIHFFIFDEAAFFIDVGGVAVIDVVVFLAGEDVSPWRVAAAAVGDHADGVIAAHDFNAVMEGYLRAAGDAAVVARVSHVLPLVRELTHVHDRRPVPTAQAPSLFRAR